MRKRKLLSIFGTRPEAIKMAPVVRLLSENPDFEAKVCITGQHREMLTPILKLFEIIPDHDLDLMKRSKNLADLSSQIVSGIDKIISIEKPELVLVHGDTATAAAAAFSAFLNKIPIAHVEAGLRTYDLGSPWPEEGNRKLVSSLAKYHYAPTSTAVKNLSNECLPAEDIILTGNTVIDALLFVANSEAVLQARETLSEKGIDWEKKIILVTGHRRENIGVGIRSICKALKDISAEFANVQIVYPVHLNPKVKKDVYSLLHGLENIVLLPPLDYLEFICLLKNSYLVLTDSGGIQEEAPSFGVPVLVMRDKTERPEGLSAGTLRLVGSSSDTILQGVRTLLENSEIYKNMQHAKNPFGDGQAANRIVKHLEQIENV